MGFLDYNAGDLVHFDDYILDLLDGEETEADKPNCGYVIGKNPKNGGITVSVNYGNIEQLTILPQCYYHISKLPFINAERSESTTYEPYSESTGKTVKLTYNKNLITTTEKYERKEEKSMNYVTLLTDWQELKKEHLKETYRKEQENLLNEDKNIKQSDEIFNLLKKSSESFMINEDTIFNITRKYDRKGIATVETKEKINELKEAYALDCKAVDKLTKEISSAISICESEESLRKVLRAYDVIDNRGKFIVK